MRNRFFVSLFALIITVSFVFAQEKSDTAREFFKNLALGQHTVRLIVQYKFDQYPELINRSLSFQPVESSDDENEEKFINARYADIRLEKALQSRVAEIFRAYQQKELVSVYAFKTIPFAVVEVSAEGVEKIFNDPEILSVSEDRLLRLPDYQPVPQAADNLYQPQLSDSTKVINADKLWSSGYLGQNWYVAILDTGIRRSHEMFRNKTIVEVCFSALAHCPNGQTSMSGTGAAAHHPSNYYGYDHGSHVSGIAAGNSSTYKGVAPQAGIIAIQVFSRFDNSYFCGGAPHCVLSYDSDQYKALEWLYQNRFNYRIAAANLSLGGGSYNNQNSCDNDNLALKNIVQNLRGAGIATAIASGNDYSCNYIAAPGCISPAIAVGATNKNDVEAEFSNFYPTLLDLYAPGVAITSSTGSSDSSYGSWQGTSMATPHVSGGFALLRSAAPGADINNIINYLLSEGKEVSSRCSGGAYKKPRLNLYATLNRLARIKPPLNLTGTRVTNKSGLLTEYIDVLSWQHNPANQNITGYRIYKTVSDGVQLLKTVPASDLRYLVRNVDSSKTETYAVLAVDNTGEEGLAAIISVK